MASEIVKHTKHVKKMLVTIDPSLLPKFEIFLFQLSDPRVTLDDLEDLSKHLIAIVDNIVTAGQPSHLLNPSVSCRPLTATFLEAATSLFSSLALFLFKQQQRSDWHTYIDKFQEASGRYISRLSSDTSDTSDASDASEEERIAFFTYASLVLYIGKQVLDRVKENKEFKRKGVHTRQLKEKLKWLRNL